MSLITPTLLGMVTVVVGIGLISNRVKVHKMKNEPVLVEEARIKAKSDHVNKFDSLFSIDFYIPARETVVTLKVPYTMWNVLEAGLEGTLTHKGGFFHTFESNDGVVYKAEYPSGITL